MGMTQAFGGGGNEATSAVSVSHSSQFEGDRSESLTVSDSNRTKM